jgi:flagellin
MNSNRQLGVTTSGQAKSSEKLSSGYRINRAGDDAAGLKISEKMRSQIRGLNKASTNAQDGVSLIQTAEGALNEAHSILQRMNELAVQGANDTNQDIDRDAINEELDALTSELDRISQTTQFNKQNLLDGTFTEKRLQVGANTNQNITISINAMNAAAIGLSRTIVSGIQGKLTVAGNEEKVAANSGAARTCAGCIAAKKVVLTSTGAQTAGQLYITGAENSVAAGDSADLRASYAQMVSKTATIEFQNSKESFTGANVDNYEKANATISVVQKAINNVSSQRSALGALQNRLEHTIANLDNVSENTQSAESRIRDTDMASEMVEYSKNNILAQAGQAMLAQANQSTQGVLSLLQ